MGTICRFLSGWLSIIVMLASPAHGGDFEFGGRPPNGIFDPGPLLDPKTTAEIAGPLTRILAEEGVEVIVVVLGSLDDAPPEFVARRFADAWCSAPVHAVVLHVPGHHGSPWIVPGGDALDSIRREVIDERLSMAQRNASREPTEPMKVRAAATEAADMLRFWRGNSLTRDQLRQEVIAKGLNEALRNQRVMRIRLLIGTAVGVLLLMTIVLLVLLVRKPRILHFPETPPPKRLGAPHAGGNHAVVCLVSSPSPPDDAR